MNKTKIEWAKNPDGTPGYTWNPITGCLNGCPYCYARKLANGRLRSRYLANKNWSTKTPQTLCHDHYPNLDPFYPRFWPERLRGAWSDDVIAGREKGIFVCDMSDLFGIGIPEDWQVRVFDVIRAFPEHRFYLLTKQPQNLIKFSPFPDNCWVGVTATNDASYMAALKGLGEVNAKVKFLSFEPLLEEVINQSKHHGFCNLLSYYHIKWVIIGAQTKPYKPPKIEWVQEIVEACDKAGIPVFLKDNLYPLVTGTPLGECTGLWAKGFKLRQEMPNVTVIVRP